MDKGVTLFPGVIVTPLNKVHHSKGDIFHVLKRSESSYSDFGEAYFTSVYAGVTKGWKKHTRMRMNLVVPVGDVTFFIHCEKEGKTESITLGGKHYARLTIEPGYWVAFRGEEQAINLVLNIASLPHDPLEAESFELNRFPLS
ncbi:dTDP-4-dehydrorhamnose 3,5-epimerase [Parendozoicomonas haliclonae]|uniref:dTDP-4-dehydrorhamnose 3,5-epimerase n=1 Tax=Parendozoicomonas haliclonae TaxID=1960125 RepID=A0A1X7ARX7_9GAMM|nr:dTDP-4-dehydrorhamnose 3,5-epimerase [Parendozoicomonas haliclonae]SMA50892.1 hypothetical protein EHSB41UT_04710 [Parendozoicomonas haliclonae]